MNREQEDFLDNIETRFKTLMIGSISRFEKYFGYLWNHGDDPKTQSESKFRDLWDSLRIDLLNHGNNQIRLAMNEMEKEMNKYSYKYNYNFKFTNKNKRS